MAFVDPDSLSVKFDGHLTLRTVSANHATLLQALSKNKSVSVDFDDDVQIDLSFLQLMESARIYANTAGRTISIAKPASGQLHDLLDRSGFLQTMSPKDARFWLHKGDNQ
ncbi:STAS domain-containing protein [Rhizobium sp. FY34]|uniref:STAS domain-containing protein n=1 Tax=Rhizobium sp. FY34 TaxID=2562309 RepID=UPI001485ABBA|nr:STAS domain-containing protein [Rhizobium sp. FY34]